jgi:cysteinyl-tRNA synthetase
MLHLYDTRSRQVEPIEPVRPGRLLLYSCGPTVYRNAHVGNMRTFLLGDLIRRSARAEGLAVTVVQNITDVGHMTDDFAADPEGEDKVLAQAQAEGKGPLEIARFYEDAFHRDLAALNIVPADHYPRASDSIELMLELIATLVERGHAYVGGDGSVFFDAQSFPSYGAISGNRLDALRPGHRFEGGTDPSKRFHADWALWKAAGRRTQLVWDSPWGAGFPGWHIECSAMSLALLGERIDVHTGGIDLRFPHHEDERAQSNSAVGHEVVQHWVHGEHVLFEGRKMAKSSGNVVLVDDLVARGLDPLALRLSYLGTRYRTQTDLTWAGLEAADQQLAHWRGQVARAAEEPSAPADQATVDAVRAAFLADLDTPRALQAVRRMFRDQSLPPGSRFETAALVDQWLGLDLAREVGRAQPAAEIGPAATALLAERAAARSAKDWSTSDRLRDQLADLGVHVVDTPDGQSWTT